MPHSISNSNTFLAYFNHIDKFLEIVLGLDAYMPFIEKVERVAQGTYPVTTFVKKYQHKLKYFGDLRNQVVHGFRLEQHHYLLASDYAVDQIKTIYEHLTKPPTVHIWATSNIPVLQGNTPLKDAVELVISSGLPALPVREVTGKYVDTLFLRQIVAATLDTDFLNKPVEECLTPGTQQALFLPSDASVYEVVGLFSLVREEEKHNEVVWITETGYPDEPIMGIITAVDLPKLDQEIIL